MQNSQHEKFEWWAIAILLLLLLTAHRWAPAVTDALFALGGM